MQRRREDQRKALQRIVKPTGVAVSRPDGTRQFRTILVIQDGLCKGAGSSGMEAGRGKGSVSLRRASAAQRRENRATRRSYAEE